MVIQYITPYGYMDLPSIQTILCTESEAKYFPKIPANKPCPT